MRISLAFVFAAALFGSLAFPATARAGISDSCGLDIGAGADCEMVVSGGCVTQCQPLSFTAQCAADLYVGCDGQCNASYEVECTTTCQGSCEAECQVDPGTFDCAASCRADCAGNCDASCVGVNDTAECRASCKATCSGECDARCNVTPPDADCMAQCQGCCEGSCDARANIDCQIMCQTTGYVDCQATLQGGCETQCQTPEGALFCDGQYVDVGSKLDQCVADLKSSLDIVVEGYTYADGECSGGSCSGEAGAGVSCMAAPGAPGGAAFGLLAGLVALGLVAMRRRKG